MQLLKMVPDTQTILQLFLHETDWTDATTVSGDRQYTIERQRNMASTHIMFGVTMAEINSG